MRYLVKRVTTETVEVDVTPADMGSALEGEGEDDVAFRLADEEFAKAKRSTHAVEDTLKKGES